MKDWTVYGRGFVHTCQYYCFTQNQFIAFFIKVISASFSNSVYSMTEPACVKQAQKNFVLRVMFNKLNCYAGFFNLAADCLVSIPKSSNLFGISLSCDLLTQCAST